MTVKTLKKSQTFETAAGSVTITGADTDGPAERCVKGYIRNAQDPRIMYDLEYDLNGVVQAEREELNLDLRNENEARLMKIFEEWRRFN
jgi:hypothetical protein